MKLFSLFTTSLAIMFLLMACQPNEKSDVVTIDATNHDFTDWNSIFEIVDTIPLQQTAQSLVSFPEAMILCDDGFVLADAKSKKIMKFALNGKFLYSTGELGRANDEYIRPLDICLSSDKKQFVLLDETGLMYYDLQNGKFQNKEKIFEKYKYWNKTFIDTNGNIFGFQPFEENTIVCKKTDGKVLSLRPYKCRQFVTRKFYIYNNVVHVLPDWGDYTIDEFEGDILKTKYYIDFGRDAVPTDWKPTTLDEFHEKDGKGKYFRTITEACESDNFLLAIVIGPEQKGYNILYNKKTKKSYVGNGLKSCCHQIIGVHGEDFYFLVYPHMINEDNQIYDYWKRLVEQGNENPIVVKVQIKG